MDVLPVRTSPNYGSWGRNPTSRWRLWASGVRSIEQAVAATRRPAARQASESLRLQGQLIDRLLSGQRGDSPHTLGERAARIGWELPATMPSAY